MNIIAAAKERGQLTVMQRRRRIEDLEAKMLDMDGGEKTAELRDGTKHHFCEGVYAREFFLPKGHTCTGRVHKTACFNVLLSGKITLAMGALEEPQVISAPQFFVSEAGEKKALYAHEDTVFITFHATELTDGDKMMDLFTVPTVKAFENYKRELLEDKT